MTLVRYQLTLPYLFSKNLCKAEPVYRVPP
jgi:hypothetical protein